MRRTRLMLAALAAALIAASAGCNVGDDRSAVDAGELSPRDRKAEAAGADEKVIRGWNAAVRADDFRRAGRFFARGAVVEQGGQETRLPGEREATAFSAGLPCEARITKVSREPKASLATFILSGGPEGACKGEAQVRFVIKGGKIREWRQIAQPGQQLPPAEPAPGESAA